MKEEQLGGEGGTLLAHELGVILVDFGDELTNGFFVAARRNPSKERRGWEGRTTSDSGLTCSFSEGSSGARCLQ